MKNEKPILFSTDMVQAILAGRKTQTRRVVNPQPADHHWEMFNSAEYPNGRKYTHHLNLVECDRGQFLHSWHSLGDHIDSSEECNQRILCPYGKPGDLLYVRETWKPTGWSMDGSDWNIAYKAGGSNMIVPHMFDDGDNQKEQDFWMKLSDQLDDAGCPFDEDTFMYQNVGEYLPWKPSIHMPKNASRIWLRVKDVRVERLQQISEQDAVAEGIEVDEMNHVVRNNDVNWGGAVGEFANLWDSINADRGFSWESNPWVWAVEFETISTRGKTEAL
jgi:hypothetical protein